MAPQIGSAVLTHGYRLVSVFRATVQMVMSSASSVTEVCDERRSLLVVSSPSQRSTRLSQGSAERSVESRCAVMLLR